MIPLSIQVAGTMLNPAEREHPPRDGDGSVSGDEVGTARSDGIGRREAGGAIGYEAKRTTIVPEAAALVTAAKERSGKVAPEK